ncbi:unnamed protein product [Psylliodes chrysocephalus]|uniref:Gustatory receptor n=1 Tax=Psylliodes chrysocephalus TaxID=3402493 RepID=A0A9P0GAC8_9CUCU|nr:unnamed protein product [Psylliodes chrysocephala]
MFIAILDTVNYILYLHYDAQFQVAVQEFLALLTLMILTIVITISGDIIENSGYKIIKLLHVLQLTVEDEFLKQKLGELSVLVVELRPSLSVCGYFDVNRRLLPMLLSSFTAYVIILIQLKQ